MRSAPKRSPDARPERKAPGTGAMKKKVRSAPGPSDQDVDPAVLEFVQAIDRYKRDHSRPFPNWSEVLQILKGLGYRKG